jgi:hypothetical protein
MKQPIKLNTMTTKKLIEFTPYLACAYAEGFCEGEDATDYEQLQAWAYLIKTGQCWGLQGWYGRTATSYIENGLITKDGEITEKGLTLTEN